MRAEGSEYRKDIIHDNRKEVLHLSLIHIFILMGYGLKKIGLLSQSDLPVFSKLVTKITLPAAIIHNFSQATMDVSMLVIVLIEMCIRDSPGTLREGSPECDDLFG